MPEIRSSLPWRPPGAERSRERQPRRLQLGNDEVHLWRAELATVEEDLGRLLSATERSRAEGIVSQRKRDMWIRARGVLRALLGSYLGIDPETVRLTVGEHGRPALATDSSRDTPVRLADSQSNPDATRLPPCNRSRLSFNLSHSGGLALYGISRGAALGVDVEVARRPIDEVAIAARVFGLERAQWLARLEPVIREREFLRAWVHHEAALKCLGTGIGRGESRVSREDLWLADLDVGSQAAAAVALERPPAELRCWDWAPQTTRWRPIRPRRTSTSRPRRAHHRHLRTAHCESLEYQRPLASPHSSATALTAVSEPLARR